MNKTPPKKTGTLVLSRRVGEEIVIGDGDVRIKVVGIKRGTVQIACRAADHTLPINREEIYLQLKKDGSL